MLYFISAFIMVSLHSTRTVPKIQLITEKSQGRSLKASQLAILVFDTELSLTNELIHSQRKMEEAMENVAC